MNEIIDKLNKITIFSEKDEYMKLYNTYMINLDDLAYVELLELIDDTYDRYKHYLDITEFTDESKYIKKNLQEYIRKYKNNLEDEISLFQYMKYIDKLMLDMIHDKHEPVFWL